MLAIMAHFFGIYRPDDIVCREMVGYCGGELDERVAGCWMQGGEGGSGAVFQGAVRRDADHLGASP